jgi:hypothetical protein
MNDPRGPLRKILAIDRRPDGTRVTLDCGHAAVWNQIYTYEVGATGRCFKCTDTFKARERDWPSTKS